jgi:hypothetical protein
MKQFIKHLGFVVVFTITATLVYSQESPSESFVSTFKQPKTALELNDYMVSITDSLYNYGTAWGAQFGEAFKSKDFSTLTAPRKNIEKFVDYKYAELNALKNIGGSEKLKAAMLEFLIFEKKMIKEQFIPLEKLDKNTPDAAKQTAIATLVDASKSEEAVLAKVREEQNAYAKKNGFTIESEKN